MDKEIHSQIATDDTGHNLDSHNSSHKKHPAGRPNKAEQLDIEMKILSCFKDKCKPRIASKHTGCNIKTVRKHYKIFYRKIIYVNESEYFRNCRISNENAILDLKKRKLILEENSEKLQSKIEALGENLTFRDQWLFIEQRKTQEAIAKLTLEINNLENTPTADITLKLETSKIFKNQVVGQVFAQ